MVVGELVASCLVRSVSYVSLREMIFVSAKDSVPETFCCVRVTMITFFRNLYVSSKIKGKVYHLGMKLRCFIEHLERVRLTILVAVAQGCDKDSSWHLHINFREVECRWWECLGGNYSSMDTHHQDVALHDVCRIDFHEHLGVMGNMVALCFSEPIMHHVFELLKCFIDLSGVKNGEFCRQAVNFARFQALENSGALGHVCVKNGASTVYEAIL
ncbi:hypothetical protein Tco_0086567 [Tanacetum coccineum]